LLVCTAPASAQPASAPQRAASFTGTLMPLNNSGVTGTFTVEQMGQGQIRVSIHATGLEPTSNPHVAHIHGVQGNTNAMCPTRAQDTDGDGYVELAEGLTTYGPIMVPLGDVDPNHDGVVDYSMTFKLNRASTFAMGFDKSSLLPLSLREIVIHGLTVPAVGQGTPGEVDGTAGYKTVLPVACGEIEPDTRMEFRTR
jgi:hypothetical protein